jgi:hypothetical protein
MTISNNRREALFDIHPVTGASIEVFFADRARHVWQGRRWMVLVVAPVRLFAGWLPYWAVRYELRSVSARDD